MPRLLLLSELHPALDDVVVGAGLVGVLPDAGLDDPQIAEDARRRLRRAGAELADIDLDGDVEQQLARIEVLVVTGGDPAVLTTRLKQAGGGALIGQAVERDELTYVGLSAGSMVAGPSLAPHLDADPEDLPPGRALDALGLADIHVLVHHGRRGREGLHARALQRHARTPTLVPLADADGLRVVDGVAELFGPQRGDRYRSALPSDREALEELTQSTDWAGRPGVVAATRDGTIRGAVSLDETELSRDRTRRSRARGQARGVGGRSALKRRTAQPERSRVNVSPPSIGR